MKSFDMKNSGPTSSSLIAAAVAGVAWLAALPLAAQSASEPATKERPDRTPTDENLSIQKRMLSQNYQYRPLDGRMAPAASDQAGQLALAVALGDWNAAAAILAQLPPDEVRPVFRRIADSLSASLENPMGRGGDGQPMLDPVDVLALGDTLPASAAMTDAELESLAQLLNKVLSYAEISDAFMNRLNKGTAHIGGNEPLRRLRAARLLMLANRPEQAAAFMPDVEQVLSSSDAATMQLIYLQIRSQAERAKANRDGAAVRKFQKQMMQLVRRMAEVPEASPRLQQFAVVNLCTLSAEMDQSETFTAWFKDQMRRNPQQAMTLLMTCFAVDGANPSPENQTALLYTQRALMPVLAPLALEQNDNAARYDRVLTFFCNMWLRAADSAMAQKKTNNRPAPGVAAGPAQAQNDRRARLANPQFAGNSQSGPGAIASDVLIKTFPDARVIDRLNPGTRLHFLRNLFTLQVSASMQDEAMETLERIGSLSAAVTAELSPAYLDLWARLRDPNDVRDPNIRPNTTITPPAIPLTRIMQRQHIQELKTLAGRLEKLQGQPLSAVAVVEAFSTIYPMNSIFEESDITDVFGPLDKMSDETALNLIALMRQNLASTWRAARPMDQTIIDRKTDQKIVDRVGGAYDLAIRIAEARIKPGYWQMAMVRGLLLFEKSELAFTHGVSLAEYTRQRDLALNALADAAAAYGRGVVADGKGDESAEPYLIWFDATVNASDLQQVGHKPESEPDRIARIRQAVLDLPGRAADRHMTMLAGYMAGRIASMKPNVRPSYARAAALLLGDLPQAKSIQNLVRQYDALLSEIEFAAAIDGTPSVGSNQPFGLRVSIRTTSQLLRESPSFWLFADQSTMSGRNAQQQNLAERESTRYRGDLEKNIRKSLAKGFEIRGLYWLDGAPQPYSFGREGWVEVPVAYVLLSATDPSVDLIPPIQVDLDFYDHNGAITLPVLSGQVPITARERGERPVHRLQISQILNDHQLGAGKISLDVKASAQGLIPDLEQLLDLQAISGFKVDKIIDQGLQLTGFASSTEDSAQAGAAVESQRVWLVNLVRDPAARTETFTFPPLGKIRDQAGPAVMEYRKYQDANIVLVTSSVRLTAAAEPTAGSSATRLLIWSGAGLAASGLIAGLLWRRYRRHPGSAVAHSAPTDLKQLTPFSAIMLLRQVQMSPDAPLTDAARQQLNQAIEQIQLRYFAGETTDSASQGLDEIVAPWLNLPRAKSNQSLAS